MICSFLIASSLLGGSPLPSQGVVPSAYYKVLDGEEVWGYFYVRSESPNFAEATLIDNGRRSRMAGWVAVNGDEDSDRLMFDMFRGELSKGEVVFTPAAWEREPNIEWRPLGDTTYTFSLEVIAFDRVESKSLDGIIESKLRVPEFIDPVWRERISEPMIHQARITTESFFKELIEEARDQYGFSAGMPYTVETRTDLYYISDQLISFGVLDYTYTGGAHGLGVMEGRTFLINGDTVERIDYENLLTNPMEGQKFIVDFCHADLVSRDDGNYVAEGAIQHLELLDISYWVLEPDSLVILFSPYAVNTYAAGTVEVRIPREQISEHIKPEIRSAWR